MHNIKRTKREDQQHRYKMVQQKKKSHDSVGQKKNKKPQVQKDL